jgi:hypothetical protein
MPPLHRSTRRWIAALCALTCVWAVAGGAAAQEGAGGARRAPLEAWLENAGQTARAMATRLEAHLPPFARSGVADLQRGEATPDAARLLGALGGLAALLLLLARAARGRGAIAVALEYPPGLRGTFRIELARRARGRPTSPTQGPPTDEERSLHEAGRASARTRWGVSRPRRP